MGALKIAMFEIYYVLNRERGFKGSTLQKMCVRSEKASKKSCSRFNFVQKKSLGAYVYLPQEWSYGAPKIAIISNIIMYQKSCLKYHNLLKL